MTDQAREIIRRAADLVEQGWCQGNMVVTRPDASRCYCMLGAVETAADELSQENGPTDNNMDSAVIAIWNALEMHGVGGGMVPYNDAPNRTQAEVVAMLRAAAESD